MTAPVSISGRSPALRAAVSDVVPAPPESDYDVAGVAKALRGARARTGMSTQQVVAVLAEQGYTITVARLRAWERTGVIRVDAAAHLADAYGLTIDTLAGRRAYRSHHPAADPNRRTGP